MQFAQDAGHRLLPRLKLLRHGDVDGFHVDAEEPGAQPVVGLVLHDVEEGRRSDDEAHAVAGNLRRLMRRAGQQLRARGNFAQRRADFGGHVRQEDARFLQDDFHHITLGRNLPALFVDAPLADDRDGLVRRQGVHAEESGGMPGEPVERDEREPVIHGVERA